MKTKGLGSLTKVELIGRLDDLMSRVDGWANLFTGMGEMNKDKTSGGYFLKTPRLEYTTQNLLYTTDGMSKRVINVVVEDVLRKGYIVPLDLEDDLSQHARTLQFIPNLEEALTWQDVFGGSVIIMGLNDGQEFDQPLNEGNLKSIEFLRVYDRWQVSIGSSNLYQNPKQAKYGEVEHYPITPVFGGDPFNVHESRVLRFDGVLLPDQEKIVNGYWGDSKYQAFWERLQGLGNAYHNIETIIGELIIGVMGVDDLDNKLQSGQGNKILKRLQYIDLSKHINNTILMDTEEQYERISASIAGLEGAITKLESAVAGITGIPYSRLFGQPPKGLNASGAENAQIEQYFDMIESLRVKKLLPQVERFVYLQMISKDGPTKGIIVKDWKVELPPLRQLTEKEIADINKIDAEADHIRIEDGVLFPGEVTESRFLGNTYGREIHISEAHEQMIEAEKKAVAEAAKAGVFTLNKEPEKTEEEKVIIEEEEE